MLNYFFYFFPHKSCSRIVPFIFMSQKHLGMIELNEYWGYLGNRPALTGFTHCLTWIYSSLTLLWQITGFSSELSFSFIASLPSLPRSKCSNFFWALFSICYRSVLQLVLSHLSICLKKWGFSWPVLMVFFDNLIMMIIIIIITCALM